MYYKIIEDGYLAAVGQTPDKVPNEIGEAEYEQIAAALDEYAFLPPGNYRLTEALNWEPYEIPPEQETAEEEDYRAALERLGVEL